MSTLCVVFFFTPGPRAGGSFENIDDALLQVSQFDTNHI